MRKSVAWTPREMPTLLINRLARALHKPVDERLKEIGISSSQLPVLVALKEGNQLTQRELAALAGVEQPSMAQLLARMERDGMIVREASDTDRRSSLISLTARARNLLDPGRVVLREIDQAACAIFTDQEKATLAGLLLRLVEHLDAGVPAAPAEPS